MIDARLFKKEFGRFLLVGATTVFIDSVVYLLLFVFLDFEAIISKGVGFSVGALFAYFANRKFTFKSYKKGFFVFLLFWAVYIVTLFVNITANELGLSFFGEGGVGIGLSLFIATGLSALLNFIGMKYLVFRVIREK